MTAAIDLLYNWQDLASGLLGVTAAAAAIRFTYHRETMSEARELKALRKALAAEVGGFAHRAREGYLEALPQLKAHGQQGITLHHLQNATTFPAAVVYPNNAAGIGNLDDDAHDVVVFYSKIATLRDVAGRMVQELSEGLPPRTQFIGEPNATDLLNAVFDAAASGADLAVKLIEAAGEKTEAARDLPMVKKMRQMIIKERDEWAAWRQQRAKQLAD